MTLRRTLSAAAASLALAGLICWGGVLPGTVPTAQAGIIGGATQTVAWGQPINLGAWEATVPTMFYASEGASALVTPSDTNPDEAALQEIQDLTRVWSLGNYSSLEATTGAALVAGLMPTHFMLDAMPCPGIEPADAEALNAADGPEKEGLDNLLKYLAAGSDDTDNSKVTPTYLGFLPYDTEGAGFNLVFLSGFYDSQIAAVAALPPTADVPFVTLVTAIIPYQDFETLLPAVDQLFASLAPAQTEAEHAAQALADYKEQRDR